MIGKCLSNAGGAKNPWVVTDSASMASYLQAKYVGQFVRYDGTTTSDYVNGRVYEVKENGAGYRFAPYYNLNQLAGAAVASEIVAGKKAYSDEGEVIEGTMLSYNNPWTPDTQEMYDTILAQPGLEGNFIEYQNKVTRIKDDHTAQGYYPLNTLANEAVAAEIASGKQAYDDEGNLITGTFTLTLEEKTATPGTNPQIILPDTGYAGLSKVTISATPLTDMQTVTPGAADIHVDPAEGDIGIEGVLVEGDANLKAENIAEGIEIFGITGTFRGGYDNPLLAANEAEMTTFLGDTQYLGMFVKFTGTTTENYVNGGIYEIRESGASTRYFVLDSLDNPAAAADVAQGKEAYDDQGNKVVGTMVAVTNKLPSVIDGSATEITAEDLAGVTQIRDYAFYSMYDLKSITFPNTTTHINSYAFWGCSSLSNVEFPDSVTSIGGSAFRNSGITNLVIPNNITSIGAYAFNTCKKLKSVTIGTGINDLGESCFANCTALLTVDFPNTITSFSSGVFAGCNVLQAIVIPDSVISMGNSVFKGCIGATSITIGSGITTIPYYTFEQCSSVTEVMIPNNVTNISGQAFQKCSYLTTVTIGSGVTNIGGQCFYNCTKLATVTMLSTTPPTITATIFQNCTALTKIIVPAGTGDTYKAATNWSTYADIIEEATA